MESIVKKELLAHATFLASDELQGRLTGSPGQVRAAAYITEHFRKLGLEPLGDELADGEAGDGKQRGYLQHYGIKRTYVDDTSMLQFGASTTKNGFAIVGAGELDLELEGELLFCGFGRTAGAMADIEDDSVLAGKIAVVAIKPPRGRVPKGLSVEQKFGMSFQALGQLPRVARKLSRKGAKAVLFVRVDDAIGLSDVLNYVALSPGKASVQANFPGADPGMGAMGGRRKSAGAPGLVLSLGASKSLLAELGIEQQAFAAFLKEGEEAPQGKMDVAGRIKLKVVHNGDARASNVCAVLRGSDPKLKHEAIVYSAHMDHVGMRMDGDVFNGADDNASGSAGLLAIATAFANSNEKPRRSIIFLSVSGEELGLWGSAYYSDNPTWQLDKIVANINTDMIGRSGAESGPLEVTVTPSNGHVKYSTIVRDAARFGEQLGITFQSGDKYYERSDHYNFARKGIPVVFFCNGEHEDYHQVSDHSDKLDGDKMQRIARLAFWTGWHVATTDKAPRALGKQERW